MIFSLLTVLFMGCEYDRSFLQMSSDSGSPFMGLQLRVDARDSSANKHEEADSERITIARVEDADQLADNPAIKLVGNDKSTAHFVPTASARTLTSSVRYTLPTSASGSLANDGSEYEELTKRQHAF